MIDGIVIAQEGQKITVFIKQLNKYLIAIPRKRVIRTMGRVYVGDFVRGHIVLDKFVIEEIDKRKNLLFKPPVANVDNAILLFTIKEPELSYMQLDKLIVAYSFLGLETTVVFNKSDLLTEDEKFYIEQLYSDYDILFISVKKNMNIDRLIKTIENKINVLCGPSGVGKSSLIKVLTNENIRVGELSPKLKKGTHTTVEIKLYTINEKTFIVDTPGFSKIDLKTIMKKEDVRNYFKEFKRYICAFRDCLHIAEDGCAVISNLSKDDFLKIKYDSYLKILKEFEL